MKLLRYICLFVIVFSSIGKANEQIVKTKHFAKYYDNNKSAEVLIQFDIKPNWHIFSAYQQEFGEPLTIDWFTEENVNIVEESFSRPQNFRQDIFSYDGYENKAFYKATFKSKYPIKNLAAEINWQRCKDECVSEKTNILVTKENDKLFDAKIREATEYFTGEEYIYKPHFWFAILMALAGGLLLNLMPCVLPVLGIKALALAKMPADKRIKEALLYGIGVVSSMLLLAGILLILRGKNDTLNWGFQLQSPWFVGFMLVLFIILTLIMTDVINLDKLPVINPKLCRFDSINSFMTGLLAVLIATPCSAPFMGAAIGYALMSPTYICFPIFLCLGLGYALPFVLLGIMPLKFSKFFPKSGKWMNVLKKILSIPLILTCMWLIWVLMSQTSLIKNKKEILWEDYSRQKVENALRNKRPVFIDWTAKWCITCMVNEKNALQSDEFEKLTKDKNILLLKADFTNYSQTLNKSLSIYGRASVPLYVYYDGKSDDYLILPQILTPAILTEYIQ